MATVPMERTEFSAGLRALADLVDASPDLRIGLKPLTIYVGESDSLTAWIDMLEEVESSDEAESSITGRFKGLWVRLILV